MSPLRNELQQSVPFDSVELEAFLNIQRTASVLAGPVDKWFKSHKMSQPLFNVLRILRGQGDNGLACSHIGERMVTRVPDVTRLVDKLIGMKLVRRERSSTDRRVVLIHITPKGLALTEKLADPVGIRITDALGHMTTAELKKLNTLLVKARKSAKGES